MRSKTPTLEAIERGKADAWSKELGGFTVYRLSNNEIDYFPYGNTPTIAGEVDRHAKVIARYTWNHVRWSRTQ